MFEVDEYCQESPDYTPSVPDLSGRKKWPGRGSKGNRQAQAARYYAKNKGKRKAYFRAYMAQRRAIAAS